MIISEFGFRRLACWCLPLAFLLVGCDSQNGSSKSSVDPRENLSTAIPDMIQLIESRDYESFVKRYANPETMKMDPQKRSIEEIAKELERELDAEQRAVLISALKDIAGKTPQLDQDGARATYTLSQPIKGNDKMYFRKIDKYWYLAPK
jgi:PBP1b-binding outer membrane lipoprotein LpoB